MREADSKSLLSRPLSRLFYQNAILFFYKLLYNKLIVVINFEEILP